jgi:hypothetical protein
LANAQLYDHRTNTWTATGPMVQPDFAQAVRLLDGRAGGGGRTWVTLQDASLASGNIRSVTNTWSAAAVSPERYAFLLVLLPDGHVLAIGGA